MLRGQSLEGVACTAAIAAIQVILEQVVRRLARLPIVLIEEAFVQRAVATAGQHIDLVGGLILVGRCED